MPCARVCVYSVQSGVGGVAHQGSWRRHGCQTVPSSPTALGVQRQPQLSKPGHTCIHTLPHIVSTQTCASSSAARPSACPMPRISPSSRLNPSCTSRVNTSTWLLALLSLSNVTSNALEWYLRRWVMLRHGGEQLYGVKGQLVPLGGMHACAGCCCVCTAYAISRINTRLCAAAKDVYNHAAHLLFNQHNTSTVETTAATTVLTP